MKLSTVICFFLGLIVSMSACRSGHFEGKSFNQLGQGFQVIPISSSQLGTCSGGPEDCRTIQIEFNILGPNREPLRDQAFEFSLEHPDFVSLSPKRGTTDSLGRIKLQASFKIRPNEAPSIVRAPFVVQSDQFGAHRFIASFNPRRDVDPLSKFEELQEDFKPETLVVEEHLVVDPKSLSTVRETEKSPQTVEFLLEQIAVIGSLSEPRMRNRKVFYEITILHSDSPAIRGSKLTDDNGELSLNFPLIFHPLDNEKIFDIKISVSLSEKTAVAKTDWYASLSFERNPTQPLMAFSRSPRPTNDEVSTPQVPSLGDRIRFEDDASKISYDISPRLELSFIPQIHFQSELLLSRKLIGKTNSPFTPIPKTRACGKIFSIRDTPNFEVISETPLVIDTDAAGQIQGTLLPRLQFPTLKNVFWAIALELPEFPKVAKAVFKFDPQTGFVSPWPMVDAAEKLKNRIYDLTCEISPRIIEAPTPQTLKEILPKFSKLSPTHKGFDDYVSRVAATREMLAWTNLLKGIFGNDPQASAKEVNQIDLIREISSFELVDHRVFQGTDEGRTFQKDEFTFSIKGTSERCFSFLQAAQEPRVHCLSNLQHFESQQRWVYITHDIQNPEKTSSKLIHPTHGAIIQQVFPF